MTKKKSWSKYHLIVFIFLILSILVNLSLAVIYFYKILPSNAVLKTGLEECLSQKEKEDCTRVFSQSKGKVICLSKEKLKSTHLSECAKNFRENLNKDALRGLKDIDDLEKFRELSIKMCMQEKGYEYK